MTALDGYALQLLDDWLAGPNNGRGGPFSNDALDGYERDVRSWLTFCAAEDIDCWATGPLTVGRWADTHRGSTARTRAKAVSVLRSFYGYAITQGIAADNPATEAVRGRVGNTPTTRVTTRECAAAIRSAADRYRGPEPERARLFVYLLLAGLRPGQICDLLIQARHTEQHRSTWDVPQKGGGTRLLAFPREITGAVDEYLPHRTHRAPAGSTQHTGPLLTSRNGRALDRESTARRLLRAVLAAGDPEILPARLTGDEIAHTPEDLRPFTVTDARPASRTPKGHGD
ncbi:tyrosine-type recombinase/integrase [Streptomyces sp. NPDC056930]|uniref:tyrosine-type recombinase/integrase n=1 Tax=Streptomyces sp. NPDC056930 TaxID=3345967 RepID=UPI00362F1502